MNVCNMVNNRFSNFQSQKLTNGFDVYCVFGVVCYVKQQYYANRSMVEHLWEQTI